MSYIEIFLIIFQFEQFVYDISWALSWCVCTYMHIYAFVFIMLKVPWSFLDSWFYSFHQIGKSLESILQILSFVLIFFFSFILHFIWMYLTPHSMILYVCDVCQPLFLWVLKFGHFLLPCLCVGVYIIIYYIILLLYYIILYIAIYSIPNFSFVLFFSL